jgi:hypothetical protein
MAEPESDKKALACNYAVTTKVAVLGSLCYVIDDNPDWGGERVQVLVHSRSGRWIRRWEVSWRLHNFRLKTIPPTSGLWSRVRDYSHWRGDREVKWFNEARDKERGGQLGNLAGLTKASVNC